MPQHFSVSGRKERAREATTPKFSMKDTTGNKSVSDFMRVPALGPVTSKMPNRAPPASPEMGSAGKVQG